ncbi:MAG: hypothetical protein K9J16_05675 [Melioribacteraceae bacterium]|nr:hypothetical protein [Melioribacteraceae bacterium]MCF8353289.1 hypothetical protein [Melioribacteraceae bacterium]MCF8394825.1 hypothetical protein [Melioribacteraceae bacterium]MCF8418816.1 hypothetical protein [Melioribacteraceae bacterium]
MKDLSKNYIIKFTALIFAALFLMQCSDNSENAGKLLQTGSGKTADENEVEIIELDKSLTDSDVEFSGLSWYGDLLIFLPQFPNKFSDDQNGILFYTTKKRINDYINGDDDSPVKLKKLKMITEGLDSKYTNWASGFESITFNGDKVYLTIEFVNLGSTSGYIIKGKIDPDLLIITLNTENIKEIPQLVNIRNFSYETSLVYNNDIYTIHEYNGKTFCSNPAVYIFDENLIEKEIADFPHIEYRITDAASCNSSGEFWTLNYFWPGDINDLKPAKDEIGEKFGIAGSNLNNNVIERLLKFNIIDGHIKLSDAAPIYLKIPEEVEGRNWEGIEKLDNKGFLLVTDTFPETIFAFLPVENM